MQSFILKISLYFFLKKLLTFKKQSDIIIIVGGITMNYKVDKLDKMQELYNLKKSYSKTNQKSYTKE